jgi:hypothetical protein
LADPLGLDAVDELHHLTMELDQLGASLAEASVGLRTSPEDFELSGSGRDVLRPRAAAVGEHFTLMEVALGASAIAFSASSLKCVQRTGQQRLSLEKSLLELLDGFAEGEQLSS